MKMRFGKLFLATLVMFFALCHNCVNAAQKPIEVECEVQDGSIITGNIFYPEEKKASYSTLVLLHSLGYNSSRWEDFAISLADRGYAVITIDFRGHGRSVYTSKLARQSWTNYKREVFQKYPDDILSILKSIREEYRNLSFDDWGIVGADIGANTAILVAEKAKIKPKTLVILSPHEAHKGLFIPIAIVDMGKIPVLSISSIGDRTSVEAQKNLKKYAQGEFEIKNFKTNTSGMLMINANPEVPELIINWLESKVAIYK